MPHAEICYILATLWAHLCLLSPACSCFSWCESHVHVRLSQLISFYDSCPCRKRARTQNQWLLWGESKRYNWTPYEDSPFCSFSSSSLSGLNVKSASASFLLSGFCTLPHACPRPRGQFAGSSGSGTSPARGIPMLVHASPQHSLSNPLVRKESSATVSLWFSLIFSLHWCFCA